MDRNLLMITSFNLLAFAGDGLSNEDITDELGVVINSQKATKLVSNIFPNPKPLQKHQKTNSSEKKA